MSWARSDAAKRIAFSLWLCIGLAGPGLAAEDDELEALK